MRTLRPSTGALLASAGLFLCVQWLSRRWPWQSPNRRSTQRRRSDDEVDAVNVLVQRYAWSSSSLSLHLEWMIPPVSPIKPKHSLSSVNNVDFGELSVRPLKGVSFYRQISDEDDAKYETERREALEDMDQFDLDPKYYHDDEMDSVDCRRPSWKSLYFPICNSFHELDFSRLPEEGVDSASPPGTDHESVTTRLFRYVPQNTVVMLYTATKLPACICPCVCVFVCFVPSIRCCCCCCCCATCSLDGDQHTSSTHYRLIQQSLNHFLRPLYVIELTSFFAIGWKLPAMVTTEMLGWSTIRTAQPM